MSTQTQTQTQSQTQTLVPGHIRARFVRASAHDPRPIEIAPGVVGDYTRLARLHYRSAAPATIARILTATDAATGEVAGVLVTSRPTLNGSWRAIAWPGRFDTGTLGERAQRLNRELRTISRVIIDPRYRGAGLASGLVRRYLCDPETALTEGVTAMAPVCPFFERAGMTPCAIPVPARHTRLRKRLAELDLGVNDLLRPIDERSALAEHLRIWARQSAGTRRASDAPIETLARAAACALIAPPTAYTHTAD